MNDAEATCGLQFCVVLCSGHDDPVNQALAALDKLGLKAKPAVLVSARRDDGRIDVQLGRVPETRLNAADVDEVLELCAPLDDEDLDRRAAAIVLTLADRAGPGVPDPEVPLLPDVIEI